MAFCNIWTVHVKPVVILSLNAVFKKLKNLDCSRAAGLFREPPPGGSRGPVIPVPTGSCRVSHMRACKQLWGCFVLVTPPSWQRAAGQCQQRATSLESDMGPQPAAAVAPTRVTSCEEVWGEMDCKSPKGGELGVFLKQYRHGTV